MLPPGYYPQAGLPVFPQPYPQATLPPAQPLAQAAAPAPKVRMQAPEEPRPAARPAVVIPSPEQLGLAPVPSSGVDWEATRGRLRQMGATSFLIDRAPAGGYRFTCWLPAEQAGKSYRVEADGTTEVEAVRLCLERADRWVRRSP